jgi:hypothetical protein
MDTLQVKCIEWIEGINREQLLDQDLFRHNALPGSKM